MKKTPLLTLDGNGIHCSQAGIYIDPWKPVERALITHAHGDHSRWGMQHYLAHKDSLPVMRLRLGQDISAEGVGYGESLNLNGVKVSFHPAGHIIGSSQIRLEYKGEVWVVSGDYKTQPDPTCTDFEPVPCDVFITESTFGLPIYRWEDPDHVGAEINAWWRGNKEAGKTSLLFGYSLGKAQRLLALLDPRIGPIFTHGAVHNTNEVLREAGLAAWLPECPRVTRETPKEATQGGIIIAPPSAMGSTWTKRFAPYATAIASGWMALRGARRRRNADRGFVLSDHADFEGLNQAIAAASPERVFVTHGYTHLYTRWLREQGYDAFAIETRYEGELGEMGEGSLQKEDEEDPA